jgi:hypothetical protein
VALICSQTHLNYIILYVSFYFIYIVRGTYWTSKSPISPTRNPSFHFRTCSTGWGLTKRSKWTILFETLPNKLLCLKLVKTHIEPSYRTSLSGILFSFPLSRPHPNLLRWSIEQVPLSFVWVLFSHTHQGQDYDCPDDKMHKLHFYFENHILTHFQHLGERKCIPLVMTFLLLKSQNFPFSLLSVWNESKATKTVAF